MACLSTRLAPDMNNALDVQVTLQGGGWTKEIRVIGIGDVRTITVSLAIHCDRAELKLFARPHDPQGDLASIGNQHSVEHNELSINDYTGSGRYDRTFCNS